VPGSVMERSRGPLPSYSPLFPGESHLYREVEIGAGTRAWDGWWAASGDLVILEVQTQGRLLKLASGGPWDLVDEFDAAGSQNFAKSGARNAPSSSGVVDMPGFKTIVASGRSPHFNEATGMTAASTTAGHPSADSSSTVLTYLPPDLMRSLSRWQPISSLSSTFRNVAPTAVPAGRHPAAAILVPSPKPGLPRNRLTVT
jgi:hypothetical protein